MSYATLRMKGQEYVLVPKAEFRRLTAQERADAAKVGRALARFRQGKLKTVSHETLQRCLSRSEVSFDRPEH